MPETEKFRSFESAMLQKKATLRKGIKECAVGFRGWMSKRGIRVSWGKLTRGPAHPGKEKGKEFREKKRLYVEEGRSPREKDLHSTSLLREIYLAATTRGVAV